MARRETPRPIRGTQSLRGEEAERFNHVVQTFDRVRRLYGFGRVEVPVFEATAVFARSLGETTDVVSKEMYSFEDRGGDSLTLRPEFTAGIARAYLTEGWQQYAPLKVATHGPLFRYERPQKGRFRQFHQLDAEVIGAAEPAADVELLCFADQLLRELKVEGVTLKLNTLGDGESREAWRAALVAHFEAYRGDLSEDSLRRLEKNPMRILDSKDPRDRPAADSAPKMMLSGAAQDFFGKVREGLYAAGVAYELAPHLVRGLDYYRHTAFEFVTDRLGAQGTVLGGGRYDGLIETLGGPATPAVGWAAGIERLAMLAGEALRNDWLLAVIPNTCEQAEQAAAIRQSLRNNGIGVLETFASTSKRQKEQALKAKVDGLLYVRGEGHDDYGPVVPLFLVSDTIRGQEALLRLQLALPAGNTAIATA
ncbi:histidine--tRNA ligase [Sandaracinobacteroides saxicola]|uniref:Histidine--tRNA ligase n=1 Tax=Sandaracinobacteroides saxicola TaxID=2759707 RepID=A0A7G5IGP2_9SPHN|nr:histidine--tRNA ligase [Sandaracinobacteroides saxicola]QMW22534.1 histidine--tRNA ligase [Sandaracinobacteroides saxicola]